jgi:hypothetical protein
MQSHIANASILLGNFEIQTYHPYIEYPSTKSFLKTLDNIEPSRRWSEQFLTPLTRMGVECLDDISIVTPESLHVFFGLPPIAIMDLFSCIFDTIRAIHRAQPSLIESYHQALH